MIVEVLKWSNENRRDETQDFPYFKVLLNPNSPWAEGKQGPNTNNKHRQIILQEDDYQAWVTVLDVLHRRYASIPKSLDVFALYAITLICDKYDLTNSLKIWASTKWCPPTNDWLQVTSENYERRLLISWVSELDYLFSEATQMVIDHAELDKENNFCVKGSTRFWEGVSRARTDKT